MKITITHEIPKTEIEYLLDSAGRGSSYWAESKLEFGSEVDTLMGGKSIIVRDTEENKVYRLTMAKVRTGLTLMAQHAPDDFADIITGSYDSNTGDAFLQFALFGELVYQ